MTDGNKKALIMVASAVLVIAGAVALIMHRRQDRGFMVGKCVPTSNTEDPLTWSAEFPIPMQMATDATEWAGVAYVSVATWNDAAGRQLIGDPSIAQMTGRTACNESGEPHDPVIFVSRLNSDGVDEKGHAHLYWDAQCHIRCAEIALPGLASKELWDKIAAHEVGHALGLDHDDYEDSAMYFGDRAMAWGMGQITAKDKSLLRSTYTQ